MMAVYRQNRRRKKVQNSPLVSAEWLHNKIDDSKLIILDASTHTVVGYPDLDENREFIPGARIFDYDQEICNQESPLPHTMPSPELFTEKVRQLGISNQSLVVIYDARGVISAPRAWWMFKSLGFPSVYVLNGGLPEWKAKGGAVESKPASSFNTGDFVATPREGALVNSDQMLEAINQANIAILDARSKGRFDGVESEPRPGLRKGHIPTSINLPFKQLLSGFGYSSEQEIKSIFDNLGVSDKSKLIFSCGSGITACIVLLGAYLCGFKDVALYDGSWAEWGAGDFPVST